MNNVKCFLSIMLLFSFIGRGIGQPNFNINNISIQNFIVNEKDHKLNFSWFTDGKIAANIFEVQYSENGQSFKTIAFVLGPDPRETNNKYQFVEKVDRFKQKPHWFRLCHVDVEGTRQFSNIIQLIK
ncbi:MAG: hypothetical protein ACOYKE_02790 [Ferruginibacter sp.]